MSKVLRYSSTERGDIATTAFCRGFARSSRLRQLPKPRHPRPPPALRPAAVICPRGGTSTQFQFSIGQYPLPEIRQGLTMTRTPPLTHDYLRQGTVVDHPASQHILTPALTHMRGGGARRGLLPQLYRLPRVSIWSLDPEDNADLIRNRRHADPGTYSLSWYAGGFARPEARSEESRSKRNGL